MKVDSRQPKNSSKKTPTTSRSSGQKSSDPQAASTLRTALTRILLVLDPRVQRVAESAVAASRNSIKKRLRFEMPRTPLKLRRTTPLTDAEVEELDKTINQLQGEAKRDETLRAKREGADQS